MAVKIIDSETLASRIANLRPMEESLSQARIHNRFIKDLSSLLKKGEAIPHLRCRFSPKTAADTDIGFYRVSSFPNLDKNNANSFSYPPEQLTNRGRCNLPKFPVFYCSDNGNTSVNEFVKANAWRNDQIIYLSEWVATQAYDWKSLSFFLTGIPENNPIAGFGKELLEKNKNVLSSFMEDRDIEDYVKFYHQIFTSDSHLFPSLAAHYFLYIDDQDMIIYPSIANNKSSCNYAIHIGLIDSGLLHLQKVFALKMNRSNPRQPGGTDNWDLIDVGDTNFWGDLTWHLPDEQDKQILDEVM